MNCYNIETLAKLTGLTRRTIRYYIQRGLLQRPYGKGRGHYYTDEHVERIRLIQSLRKQGMPLAKIKEYIEEGGKAPESFFASKEMAQLPPIPVREEVWNKVSIGEEVELFYRAGSLADADVSEIVEFIKRKLRKEV